MVYKLTNAKKVHKLLSSIGYSHSKAKEIGAVHPEGSEFSIVQNTCDYLIILVEYPNGQKVGRIWPKREEDTDFIEEVIKSFPMKVTRG